MSGIERLLRAGPWLWRGFRSSNYARAGGAPGMLFDSYGRRAGIQALARGHGGGLDMLLRPVSIVRYWEFPFVLRNLPAGPFDALDVGSPRLFSCYVASRHRSRSLHIINPDTGDAGETARLVRALSLHSVSVDTFRVAELANSQRLYDVIWSISVIEHIPDDGDIEAAGVLWEKLRPGGRLIITVPSDRHAWDEYRTNDEYGLNALENERGYFFQRYYDEATIHDRLLAKMPGATIQTAWFGEKSAGHFAAYETQWLSQGPSRTLDDARDIADHYRSYPSWASMRGQGVAGLVVDKGLG